MFSKRTNIATAANPTTANAPLIATQSSLEGLETIISTSGIHIAEAICMTAKERRYIEAPSFANSSVPKFLNIYAEKMKKEEAESNMDIVYTPLSLLGTPPQKALIPFFDLMPR